AQTPSPLSAPPPQSPLRLPYLAAPLWSDIIRDACSWCPAAGESHVGKVSASYRQSIGVLSGHAPLVCPMLRAVCGARQRGAGGALLTAHTRRNVTPHT